MIAARPLNVQTRAGAVRGGDRSAEGARELLGRILGAVLDPERLAGRDLCELSSAGPRELAGLLGVPARTASRLSAAFELGRRVERAALPERPVLRAPERVHALLGPELRGSRRETFFALLLDGKHRLQRAVRVSEGTLTTSLVHPREFFGPAVREGAAAVVAAHNHPSGDPEPSVEDLEVTRRLHEAGRLLGIPLLDHVVIGDGRFVSLRGRLALGSGP